MRIIALSFACLSPLYALTLNEVIDFTLKNSPEIEINLQKRDIAKAELSKSYGEYLPTVNLNAEFSDQRFDQKTDGAAQPGFNYWHKDFDIEVKQNVFDGLYRYNQIQQNKNELRSQQYVYHNSIFDITLEIAKLVYQIHHAEKVIEMAKENFNKISEIKELIAKRVKEGIGKDIELVQANGRLAVAKTNILESVRELRNLKAQFTQITGGLKADHLKTPRVLPLKAKNYQQFWRQVQENGHGLRPYYALQKSSLYSYKAQKGTNLPSVDLYAKYKYDHGIAENPNTVQKTRNLGLRAQWAVFEGGRRGLDTYIHAQKYQQSKQELKKQQQSLRFESEKAWQSHSILSDSLPFLKKHTDATLKITRSYFDQFLIGQKSLLDLLDAHNELLRARKNEDYNKMLVSHNRLEISHLRGTLLEELKITCANSSLMGEEELLKFSSFFETTK